jgi:filamentous hemagglutinin family protein
VFAGIGNYKYTNNSINNVSLVTGDSTVGNTRTISNNNNAILNWNGGLNINTNEKLTFDQCVSCKVLNRVGGGNPTTILGTMTSAGKVFLINNAGVVVSKGAVINTNGFVASSLDISDDDFTAGKNRFTASTTNPTGIVSNAGAITTPNGGFVYLIGAQVTNSGVITSPSGEAILAAGSSVELVDSSDPSMRVLVKATALPVNLSLLMAQSNGDIFSVLNSGKISANSAIVGQNGKIQLRSAGALTTTASSVLEAKGDAGTDGGLIRGFADSVGHYSGSFDVSGRNGGLIETSAAYLHVDPGISIAASAFAPKGKGGKWLLDPFDFTITQTEADIISDALNNGYNVDIETSGIGYFYGGPSDSTIVNGTSNVGRITMTNANILKSMGGFAELDFVADEKVIITGSTITDTSGQFGFRATGNQGVSINNSTIQASGGNSLIINSNSGNISIVGSQLTSLSPAGSGTTVDIAAYSGNVNIDNSSVGFLNTGSYAGTVNITANVGGDINIINQSQIGSLSGDSFVNINTNGGSINIANSAIGVKTGALGGSKVNINALNDGNVTMTGASSTNHIRAHEVDLDAEATTVGNGFGQIGATDHFIVTEADLLQVGSNHTENAYITDLAQINKFNITVTNDTILLLQQGASLTTYGGSINAKSAVIGGNGDISLTGQDISFDSGSSDGSFTIATSGIIKLDGSSIYTSGGIGSSSLDMFASGLSLSNHSSIDSDFVGFNYDIGSATDDPSKRLGLAAFAKSSTVDISGDSEISGSQGVGIVTGTLNVTGGNIYSYDVLDIVVAKNLNITGDDSGGYASYIHADNEAFLTVGGTINVNSGDSPSHIQPGYIEVASSDSLFMNFPLATKDGWSVDGVANVFDSKLNSQTGIFVDGAAAIIGLNTTVKYGGFQSALGSFNGQKSKDLLTNANNTPSNFITQHQDAADKFFGSDDDSDSKGDSKGNSTGDSKKNKSKPKECSA